MDHFPENTMSQFRTKLPTEMHLEGTWEVGLCDLTFPKTFLIPSMRFQLYAKNHTTNKYVTKTHRSKEKYFKTKGGFIRYLNQLVAGSSMRCKFQLDLSGVVQINLKPDHGIMLTQPLKQILGFAGYNINSFYNPRDTEDSISGLDDLELPHVYAIYVYTDIVEPVIVGDSLVKLLDIVPVNNDGAEMCDYRIEKPRYVPLQTKNILFPKIELMRDDGTAIPFAYGKVVAKLHFRRI